MGVAGASAPDEWGASWLPHIPGQDRGIDSVRRAVAFILKGYPRLSETFIAQEIRALEGRGLDIRIVSLRRPTDRSLHDLHHEIEAPVHYLPEYLYQEPRRVVNAWRQARRRSNYPSAARAWRRDLVRDRTSNRMRRFGQALVLASELPHDVVHLHAHFLHTPASVARYTSILTGLPWTCSAHARDIWTSPAWELREKLRDCHWAVTCTAVNERFLGELACDADRVELIYHGLDSERFPARGEILSSRDGSRPEEPVRVLSIGRAVEKKGYDDLLHALAGLDANLHWRFDHVGAGPWLETLRQLAARLGLADRTRWWGALSQGEVRIRYAEADLFALASRTARDGDRDGLPNVLLEAQSQSLACVATDLSAIPELIEDGANGLLTPERDVPAMSRALETLITNPSLRARMGRVGAERVRRQFKFETGIDRLFARFSRLTAQAQARPPKGARPAPPAGRLGPRIADESGAESGKSEAESE